MNRKELRQLKNKICPDDDSLREILNDPELSAAERLLILSSYSKLLKDTKFTKKENLIKWKNKTKKKIAPKTAKIRKKIRVWIKRRKISINYLRSVYGKNRYGRNK